MALFFGALAFGCVYWLLLYWLDDFSGKEPYIDIPYPLWIHAVFTVISLLVGWIACSLWAAL